MQLDPLWLAILAPLVVAAIGGLFKLALRGLDAQAAATAAHLVKQDETLDKHGARMRNVELQLAELLGIMSRHRRTDDGGKHDHLV